MSTFFFFEIHFLRQILIFVTLVFIVWAPDAGVHAVLERPLIVPTLILPACAPLLAMLVLLDLMMLAIMSSCAETPKEKRSLRTVIWTESICGGLLVVAWLPFFLSIGNAG